MGSSQAKVNKSVLTVLLLASFLSVQLASGVAPVWAMLGGVGNMSPAGGSSSAIGVGEAFAVSVQVYKTGVTEPLGQGADIACILRWGPVDSFGGTWTDTIDAPMTYSGDAGSNDEYEATISPGPGLYEFTALCTDTTDGHELEQGDGNGMLTVRAPDLEIVKRVDPPVALPGRPVTYTLAFSNTSSVTATGVLITDVLPLEIVPSGVISAGVAITQTNIGVLTYTWAAADLAPGAGGLITITGQLSSSLLPGYVFTNSARITTTLVDTDTANNASSAAVTVPSPDLAISKTVSPEPNIAGTSMVYTITIVNQGPYTATGIVLSDTLPSTTTMQHVDQTDDDDDLLGFGGGTYENTYWHDIRPGVGYDDWVALIDPALSPTGVFSSRVMDAGNVSAWTDLAWASRRPTWKPLPDGGAAETDYALGNANMAGNRVLLHLDAANPYSDTSGLGLDARCPAAAGEDCPSPIPSGRFNGGLRFDGTLSNTVVVTDPLDPARYAIELWVRPETITDTSFIQRTDVLSGTAYRYSHLLGISDERFVHLVDDGSVRAITSTVEVTTGVWYHVVGTAQSGGDIKLYVNGTEEASLGGIGTLWAGGDQYRLGSTYGMTGTAYFSGDVDEVAVYSRTLSAAEVTDHYLRGALRLGFQVRSCDDAACAGEAFSATVYTEQGNATLGLPTVSLGGTPDNRYFQYRVSFESDDPVYSPELQWVRVRPDHRVVLASQGTCALPGASAFTCTLGSLAGGAVATVTVPVGIDPSALGVITNTASVTTPYDPDPANNTTIATTTVTALSDLRVNKWDAEHHVNLGGVIQYHIDVYNYGPSTARSVVVTDVLPASLVGYPSGSGWTCSAPGNTITCSIPTLLPGEYGSEIVVTATAPMVEELITNTVEITSTATPVYTTTHLTDTEQTFVTPLADLVIEKSAFPNPVNPGDTLTYTVVVTNNGPYTATGVVVIDTVLFGLTGTASGSGWSCGPVVDDIVCTLTGDLLATQSASFTISVTAPMSGLLGNYAFVDGDQIDPEPDDNEVVAYAAVLPVADLLILKRDDPDPVYADSPLTYALTITNTGPVPAGALTATLSYTNGRRIYIDNDRAGRAWRYPSNLPVGGVPGLIRDLTVRLYDVSHTYPGDLSILLVAPSRQGVVLMSNAGGGAQIDDVTLTIRDAGTSMPISGPLTSTVTYRPTNYGLGGDFLPPAPGSPYGGSLSAFYGSDPNGLWRLYVIDNVASDGGSIAGGWSLHFSTMTTDTVTLTDTLPSGLTGVGSAVPAGWSCSMVGDEWTCTADALAVNVPTFFTVTATAPITGGVITNTAAITSTTTDLWPDGNTTLITTTVVAVTDLEIVKVVTPTGTIGAGSPITYALVVSNAGPSPLSATVTVTDLLPAGLGGISVSGTGWSCMTGLPQAGGRTPVTCTVSGLLVGRAPGIVITATAPVTPGVIANTAGITAVVYDPDGLNNTASVTVTVAEHADLEIEKSVSPAVVTPDALLTFTLQITNAGPSTVTAVSVTDVATNVSSLGDADVTVGTGWACTTVGNAFTCTVAALAAGDGATIVVTATAPSSAGAITNTAAVTAALIDLAPGNNAALVTATVSTAPVADAGPDQTVYVDELVTLDGTGSTDAEGDLPLTYGWTRIGGPAVTLSPSAAVGQPTFTAPSTPTMLTFALVVTDSLGLCSGVTDTVVITVVDRAIETLEAFDDSPTLLGHVTNLWATVLTGTNVSYAWSLGDGDTDVGQAISHTYASIGWYTATVTATNSVSSVTATTQVSITELGSRIIYLPLVTHNFVVAPDLVVDSIAATGDSIEVVIRNQGAAPIERAFANEFWVDVYVNPSTAPTAVNQTWQQVGSQGGVWGVTEGALPLNPGDTLTLRVTSAGGTYYRPGLSYISWPLAPGTRLYAQVDSAHTATAYGAIRENHEIVGVTYNNITGPVLWPSP